MFLNLASIPCSDFIHSGHFASDWFSTWMNVVALFLRCSFFYFMFFYCTICSWLPGVCKFVENERMWNATFRFNWCVTFRMALAMCAIKWVIIICELQCILSNLICERVSTLLSAMQQVSAYAVYSLEVGVSV